MRLPSLRGSDRDGDARARPPVRRASRLGVVALALALGVAGCGRACGSKDAGSTVAAAAVEAPAPAPDGLLAELVVPTPDASWLKVQRGIGGAAGILPSTLAGVIGSASGLDLSIAEAVDGRTPFYGVVAGDPANPAWLLAMRLVDPGRARGAFVDGETARFTAREAGDLTELLPKGGAYRDVAIALSRGGYLLAAGRAEDLARLAPYATRTLPSRPSPGAPAAVVVDVPRAALADRLAPKLESAWTRAKAYLLEEDERIRKDHGGRAPDFGDPKAIVAALDGALRTRLAVLSDLERVRLSLEMGDDDAVLTATMTPRAAQGPAAVWASGMKTGDVSPLLAQPARSSVAVLVRDADDARAEQAKSLEEAMASALGERLAPPVQKRLHDVLDAVTHARGDVVALSALSDEPGAVFVRAAIRDGDAAGRAVRGALDLSVAPPFRELLRLRDVKIVAEEAPDLGKLTVATLAREPAKSSLLAPRGAPPLHRADAGAPSTDLRARASGEANRSVHVAWTVADGALSVLAAESPTARLRGLRADKKLADEPEVARLVGSLGDAVSTVLVAQPLRLDPARAALPAAPAVIAVGRKGSDAFVRVDVSLALLREGARSQLGF